MSIGNTTGKEPDPIMDEDLKSPEELRGAMKDLIDASLSVGEKATVKGIAEEIEVIKLRLADVIEQSQAAVNLAVTLQRQFQQFEAQRAKELNLKVRGGSTTPEDWEDGT
jgi:hypothetical protein